MDIVKKIERCTAEKRGVDFLMRFWHIDAIKKKKNEPYIMWMYGFIVIKFIFGETVSISALILSQYSIGR